MLFITYFWWQACKVWKIYRKLKKEGKTEKKVKFSQKVMPKVCKCYTKWAACYRLTENLVNSNSE